MDPVDTTITLGGGLVLRGLAFRKPGGPLTLCLSLLLRDARQWYYLHGTPHLLISQGVARGDRAERQPAP